MFHWPNNYVDYLRSSILPTQFSSFGHKPANKCREPNEMIDFISGVDGKYVISAHANIEHRDIIIENTPVTKDY